MWCYFLRINDTAEGPPARKHLACISFCFFNLKKIRLGNKETFFDEVQATCTFGTINEWNVINNKIHHKRFFRDTPLRTVDANEWIRLKEWEALSAEKLKDGSCELCTQPTKMALLRALQKPGSVEHKETVLYTCWFTHNIFFGSSRKREHQTNPPPPPLVGRAEISMINQRCCLGSLWYSRTFIVTFYTSTCLREGSCISGGRLYEALFRLLSFAVSGDCR